MNCKLEKLEIPANQPFKNCKLDREKYAEVLKTIITTYEKGFVLAINGQWGTGKTTFVEMFKAYLELDQFHTLYFNAWENDFVSDPLVGLLGELKNVSSQKKAEAALTSVINTAGKIVLKAAPSILKGVIQKYAGKEVVDILCDCAEEGSSMLKKEIENYETQRSSLAQFRQELEKFVDEVCAKKPLVFIIDELDRCNPHYAVKVLERIKHLFSIPNIVFILAIDKQQLKNSICGYYGSDLIDADQYLKRFIDIEYTLPEPDIESFCSYLFDYYGFNCFFSEMQNLYNKSNYQDDFSAIAISIFKYKKTTLRQIEKIFTNIHLSLKMFNNPLNIHIDLLCLLTYLRICETNFYENIIYKNYTAQELIDQIEIKIPKQIFDLKPLDNYNYNYRFHFTIALLLECYIAIDFGAVNSGKLLTKQNENLVLNIKVNIINEKLLTKSLEWVELRLKVMPLEYITTKINLLTNLQN